MLQECDSSVRWPSLPSAAVMAEFEKYDLFPFGRSPIVLLEVLLLNARK
jgi:hypothetical protein